MCDTKNYMRDIKSVQDTMRKEGLMTLYRPVILGFTILRRLTQTLEPTMDKVLKEYEKQKAKNILDEDALMDEANQKFYNISGITFEKLKNDAQSVYTNIISMVKGFSSNVDEILGTKGLKIIDSINSLNSKKILSEVVEKYAGMDFSPKTMSNANMGAFFGELVVMLYGTPENGQNWTPSDFVEVLTKLLLAEDCEHLKDGYNNIKLLDNAMGSGQLTSYFEKYVKKDLNETNRVEVFGQDNEPVSVAVCKAEQLILGQDPSHFIEANTLYEDKFPAIEFDYLLQNAPYGCGRKKDDEDNIKKLLGKDLPKSDDNQMLFWKAGIRKLKKPTKTNPNQFGRAALLSNGSPLFASDKGSNAIRKWLLESDYVEAIIKLTDSGFIDTGISIYAWIISTKKSDRRKGLIQIIDASNFSHPMKKSVGEKRKEMNEQDIKKIVTMYKSFPAENEYVKNMTKEDFYFYEVTVNQPYQRNYQISEDRIPNLFNEQTFNKLYSEDIVEELKKSDATEANLKKLQEQLDGQKIQNEVIDILKNNPSKIYDDRNEFEKLVKIILPNIKANIIKSVVEGLSEKDKTSKTYADRNSKSKLKADSDLKDTEYIPFKYEYDDKKYNNVVDAYFDKEVKPFVPDAWYEDDYKKIEANLLNEKVGCEINFNKYFYKFVEPKSTDELIKELKDIDLQEQGLLETLIND